ncbi:MAG: hypothetical protein JNM31_00665 [Flavobacteriales bacterium]|nr:hypothetical protein [Flavobacteriales bacterium]
MIDPLEILAIIGTSMVKFAVSPLVSYGLGYSFLETLIVTSIGGCLGVLVFHRSASWFMQRARLRRLHQQIAMEHGALPRKHRTFTRSRRFIVRIKTNQGLQGLALLTPVVLSIPLGSIIAAKYFPNDRRTLPVLLSSVVIWSAVLSSVWTFAR